MALFTVSFSSLHYSVIQRECENSRKTASHLARSYEPPLILFVAKLNREKGSFKLSSLIFFCCSLEIKFDNIPCTVLEASSVKKVGKVKDKKGLKYSVYWIDGTQVKQWGGKEVSSCCQWIRRKQKLDKRQLTWENRIPADLIKRTF